jgi:hypothetical protein
MSKPAALSKILPALVAGVLVAAIAGCAPTTERPTIDQAASESEAKLQRGMAFDNAIQIRHRVNNIANRILVAGADLCGKKVKPRQGITLTTAAMYQGAMLKAAREAGYDDTITISAVMPGGPADQAGIRAGDQLVRLGASGDLPPGADGMQAVDKALAAATLDPFPVTVRRAGQLLDLTVQPVLGCDYGVSISEGSALNAYADGSKIVLFTGMVKFAATDEELALIVGHELAHNLRGHIDAKRGNAVLGIILDAIVAGVTGVNMGTFGQMTANANSADFEAEADYVGLYIMARAGYPIDDAPKFWRRMAVENPKAISHTTTHPATNDRFVALGAAIAEIGAKKAAGLPLIPNEKK